MKIMFSAIVKNSMNKEIKILILDQERRRVFECRLRYESENNLEQFRFFNS